MGNEYVDLEKRLRAADEYNAAHYVRDPFHVQSANVIAKLRAENEHLRFELEAAEERAGIYRNGLNALLEKVSDDRR